ncbi:hypothetical protein BH09ACT10_BH09ACT10_31610 [soil metagenome]
MQRRLRWIGIAFASISLVFATASAASADHDAGLEGSTCAYGGGLAGGPSETLGTSNWKTVRVGGALALVCSFKVPLFVPVCDDFCLGETKGDWTAPTRPKSYTVTECFPPGTDLAGQTTPNGEGATRAPSASIVFYRTKAVMACFWPDDPTDEPGYWDPPPA